MRCKFCEEEKPDVEMRPDPWAHEVEGDETPVPICDDCARQRFEDS